jgi:hypothetical protein
MEANPAENPLDDRPLQKIEHAPATARIPDAVGRGVFATGAIVLHGADEFAIDFVQSLVRPERVAARVVLPPAVASQFALALDQSLRLYAEKFGGPPREPDAARPPRGVQNPPAADAQSAQNKPPSEPPPASSPAPTQSPPQPAITDHYERLKLPDEMLGGAYANLVTINQTGSEFCFDFIAKLYPRAAVTSRVYMAAARVPDLLASLQRSIGG